MALFLRKTLVLFIALAGLTCLVFTEEVNVDSLLRNSFYNSDLARRDRNNQKPESLKIKTDKLNLVSLADLMQSRGHIFGETVVCDSGTTLVSANTRDLEENKVKVIGNNAFVKINNRIHQIPVSISGESDPLEKFERRDIETAIADSFNNYGITPAKAIFKDRGDPVNQKILIFKSQFTNTYWDYNEFPIIIKLRDLIFDEKSSLYVFYNCKKYMEERR
jgi:hypothetical protein